MTTNPQGLPIVIEQLHQRDTHIEQNIQI